MPSLDVSENPLVTIDETFRLSAEAMERIGTPVPNRPVVDFSQALDNQLEKVLKRRREIMSQYLEL